MTEYAITAKTVPAENSRWSKPSRIYCWPQGETLQENLYNRRHRPIKEFRTVAQEGLRSLGIDPDKYKLAWRQKAGCDCGCSPGFIVEGPWDLKLSRQDVHVDFTTK